MDDGRTEWEKKFAYSRVKRKGPLIETAGIIAIENGKVVYPGNMYEQSKYIIQKLPVALQTENTELEDLIRTPAYVTDINQTGEVGRAHAEFFERTEPVMTLVEVNALILEGSIVEIEMTAWKD